MKTNYPKKKKFGFTLVEVIISIGIIASVSIPMVALMALGLENMKESRSDLVRTRIERHLATSMNQSDWGNTNSLEDFQGSYWYYDQQGTSLEDEADERLVFVARVGVDVDESGSSSEPGLQLPGAPSKNKEMRRVTVTVSDRPRIADPFDSPSGTSDFSFIVTRTDRR